MANDIPKGNNKGTLLTTLAASGDRAVQLLLVGGIILNTVMTKNNTSNIHTNSDNISINSRELDKLRNTVAQQIKVIYDNQRAFADFMDETRAGIDRLQTDRGIPHPPSTPYPRQEVSP